MSGKTGMHHGKPRVNTTRRNLWRSMRILKRFTLPDLIRTVPGCSYGNARKFVAALAVHGYVAKNGAYYTGCPGVYQGYRLARNNGPDYPTICDSCGQALTVKTCKPAEKETEKEREKEREIEREIEAAVFPEEVAHDAA
jgi:hypothetical protein